MEYCFFTPDDLTCQSIESSCAANTFNNDSIKRLGCHGDVTASLQAHQPGSWKKNILLYIVTWPTVDIWGRYFYHYEPKCVCAEQNSWKLLSSQVDYGLLFSRHFLSEVFVDVIYYICSVLIWKYWPSRFVAVALTYNCAEMYNMERIIPPHVWWPYVSVGSG